MRRLAVVLLFLCCASKPRATTYYVDGACPTAGNGSSSSCLSSPTTNNPKKLITDGIALLGAGGDVLNIRGVHAAHNTGGENCPGSTDGLYTLFSEGNSLSVTKVGAAGNEIVMQPNGYVGAGTGEVVRIEGVKLTTSGWTQCSVCNSGTCNGVTGTCGDVWYYTLAGEKLYFARKANGTVTHRRSCRTGDGDSVATCNARITSTYDAVGYFASSNWDGEAGETILVRWGPTISNPNSTAGTGVNWGRRDVIDVQNTTAYFTIQGLGIYNGGRAAIEQVPVVDHLSILNNTISLFNDSEQGSARPIATDSLTNMLIQGNDISYSSSEPIHISTYTSGVTSGLIKDNFVHDIGDNVVLGDGTRGTPNCTTFTNDAPLAGYSTTGDFSGLTVEGNIFRQCNEPWRFGTCNGGACGAVGILLESACDGMTVRSNIISGVEQGFKWGAGAQTTDHANNHKIYDNLIYGLNDGQHAGPSDCFHVDTGGSTVPVQGNEVWNNTCVGFNDSCLKIHTAASGSGVSGNEFENNICQRASLTSPSVFLVDSPTGVNPGTLANNVAWGGQTSGQIGNLNGASYNCSTDPATKCADPAFVNAGANNYHIQTSSPAKNAGTTSGMPSGRTSDINNTIASAHGLPAYNDGTTIQNGVWDIGADEIPWPTLTISKSDSPDPVNTGYNLTYTLSYHNTGAADATGVTISDTIPTHTTFYSATNGGSLSGSVVTWSIGTVAAGGSGSVQLIVTVDCPLINNTVITNGTYSISSNELSAVSGVADTTTAHRVLCP